MRKVIILLFLFVILLNGCLSSNKDDFKTFNDISKMVKIESDSTLVRVVINKKVIDEKTVKKWITIMKKADSLKEYAYDLYDEIAAVENSNDTLQK